MSLGPLKPSAPKVAVVMPAYNCERYVETAVLSVINQTHSNRVLFVTNDASTDGTLEKLKALASQFPDIVLIENKSNLGCDESRNAALDEILMRRTEFDYVAFIDSDDIWEPEHLANAVRTFESSSEFMYDMYYCDTACCDSEGNVGFITGTPKFDHFDRANLLNGNFIYVSTVVVRLKAMFLNSFDRFCDPKGDWDMWLRLSAKGGVVYNPQLGSTYRWKNEGSYYSETESEDSKLRVEIKHGIIRDKDDAIRKLEIIKEMKNECVRNQLYERASRLRDSEKFLLSKLDSEYGQRIAQHVVLIHPYSHLPDKQKTNPKNYPHWEAVVSKLKEHSFYVVQVGVAGEKPIGADEMVFNASMPRLLELLEKSDTFICVDSFLQHFAHYHGKHGVVIFGPSDPLIFGHEENSNLLKSRSVLRPNQFETWNEWDYRSDIFPDPIDVVGAVLARVKAKEPLKELDVS